MSAGAEATGSWLRRHRVDLLLLLGYLLAGLWALWPAPLTWGSHLASTPDDGYQCLFNLFWMREAIATFSNPYHTPYLFHPEGVTLLFHTLSPYNAVLGAAFSLVMDWLPAYNLLLLLHYALAGYVMYRLALHLTDGHRPAAALAGLLFTLSPFHFYQGQEHLQLTAIEGVPLTLLFLLRTLEAPGRRDAVLLGLSLVLVAYSDHYLLLFTGLAGLVLVLGRLVGAGPAALLDRAVLGRLALAAAVFLVLAGPLLGAMLWTRATTELVSGHQAWLYSADLQSLLVPGPHSAWGGAFAGLWSAWTGNPTEQAGYLGYALLLGALLGLWRARALPYRRSLAVLALLGALLSLGPSLVVGGEDLGVPLPHAAGEVLLPLVFAFSGTPARFAFLANLGLVLLFAGAVAWLWRWPELGPRLRQSLALGLGLLALVELAPGPQSVTRLPVPAPFRQWAAADEEFSVVDTRYWGPAMYGIVRHHKPLANGHTSRDPLARRWALKQVPVFDALLWGHDRFGDDFAPEHRAVVADLDLDWGVGPPAPGLARDFFAARFSGTLRVTRAGNYVLACEARGGLRIWFDGELRVDRGDARSTVRASAGPLWLDAGEHPLVVEYLAPDGRAALRLLWREPDRPWTTVGPTNLRTLGGQPGLDAVYGARRPVLPGGRAAALAALRARDVRYLVRWPWQNRYLEERLLDLRRVLQDDRVVIYEVPAVPGAPATPAASPVTLHLPAEGRFTPAAARPERRAEIAADGAWCWFQDERALIVGDRVVVGSVSGAGDVQVHSFDWTRRAPATRAVLHAALERDDHDAPGLVRRRDGRLMAVYARHHREPRLYWRVSRRPGSAAAWGPEQVLVPTPEHNVTYANPLRLAAEGDRLYLCWRGLDYDATCATTDDDGAHWSAPVPVIRSAGERPYVKYATDGAGTIHFVFTPEHPDRRGRAGLFHAVYHGGTLYRSDGTAIGPWAEGLTPEQATRLYDGARPTGEAWVWDLALDPQGRPVVVYATVRGATDHRYRYARWTGAAWEDRQIAFGGTRLYSSQGYYSGGIALDPDDVDVVYLSADVNPVTGTPTAHGRHEIFRGATTDRGATWTYRPLTPDAREDHLRPIVPAGHPPGDFVLWFAGEYPDYANFRTRIELYADVLAGSD